MWEPRRLTTLWAFTACYRDSFTVFNRLSRYIWNTRLERYSLANLLGPRLQYCDFPISFTRMSKVNWILVRFISTRMTRTNNNILTCGFVYEKQRNKICRRLPVSTYSCVHITLSSRFCDTFGTS
jgi:hypothetical protein